MLTEIRLYGRLGRKFGRRWRLNVPHPARVVSALDWLRPGFRRYILEDLADFDFHVQVGGETIGEDKLLFPNNGKVVSITPVLKGSDTKQLIQIIAGAVLVVAGAFTWGTSATIGLQLILAGAALSLGGVAGLLAPSPATPTTGPTVKNKPSYIASSPVNTIEQGLPVPVLLGEGIQGSAVVSAGAENRDIGKGSGTSDTSTSSHSGPGAAEPIARNWAESFIEP